VKKWMSTLLSDLLAEDVWYPTCV